MPAKKPSKAKPEAGKEGSKLPSRSKRAARNHSEDREQTNEVIAEPHNGQHDDNQAAEEPDRYSRSGSKQQQEQAETGSEPEPEQSSDTTDETAVRAGQKRKEPPDEAAKSRPNAKAPRQGTRSSTRHRDNPASPGQLLNFLLSAAALRYCFPEDELADAKKSRTYKSYSLTSPTSLAPFEHLLCSHMLSKPLSHKLGMRSIRTLLNEPFSLNSAEAITSVGQKRVWEALEAARTQHRQKTATYIFETAQSYSDSETMSQLADAADNGGPKAVTEHIKSTVAGLGVVGAGIFCRRIQCVDGWGDALWPYADGKSIDAMKEIGIPVENAGDLHTAIERDVDWDIVGDMGVHGGGLGKSERAGEQQTRGRARFVIALERAVGCVLEGNVRELRQAAAKVEGQ
ncbi:hypothetical protein A1O7_02422 [Cladophialophora yegresii CBS 114405]|uniref:Uncharacterized protein n=1 Tax=Cladophialophora yegresii CBS 114405 TaxID=1182544 RepID=W9WAH7_9EURO|nr:uncharacterized protein A1O7_02422 [Cladophialophora yegresii CBS 114405]EXJ61990.1 hypothetical protein A1O7_02422 [Cladophialophora yegresii CBS 114405]